MMTDIQAIIFDCDGVLVDSEVIFLDEEIAFLKELGLSYSFDEYVERFMGLNSSDWLSALTIDHAAAGLGALPDDFLERKRARTWPRILSELTEIEGAKDLAVRFDGPIATASSSAQDRLEIKLEITGLADVFAPHIYSADLVENGKPAPDLFLHAAQKLSIPPANCLVIEDSENGVKAGLAAGMYTVGFTGGGHADDALHNRLFAAGAAHVYESHAEISRWLAL